MKARRHHPRLSRLLGEVVGSESQGQAMIALYLLRRGWSYPAWITYRRHLAALLSRMVADRHAVQRHSEAVGAKISTAPTLTIAPEGSGLTEALRASEESS